MYYALIKLKIIYMYAEKFLSFVYIQSLRILQHWNNNYY